MKKSLIHCLIAAAMLALTSCGVYYPRMEDIPVFREKGDAQVSLSCGELIFLPYQVGLTTSYAATDHLGLQASASAGVLGGNARVSAGYYTTLSPRRSVFFSGGVEYSKSTNEDSNRGITPDKFTTYSCFANLDYGWRKSKRFEMAFRLGGGLLVSDALIYNRGDDPNEESSRNITLLRPFLEPSATMRFGWQHFKFDLRAGWSILPNDAPYAPFMMGLGFTYSFNPLSKRK